MSSETFADTHTHEHGHTNTDTQTRTHKHGQTNTHYGTRVHTESRDTAIDQLPPRTLSISRLARGRDTVFAAAGWVGGTVLGVRTGMDESAEKNANDQNKIICKRSE